MLKLLIFIVAIKVITAQDTIFCAEELDFYVRTKLQAQFNEMSDLQTEVEVMSNQVQDVVNRLRNYYLMLEGAETYSLINLDLHIIQQISASSVVVNSAGGIELTAEQEDLVDLVNKKYLLELKKKQVLEYETELAQKAKLVKDHLLKY